MVTMQIQLITNTFWVSATAVGAILVGLFESYASFFNSSLKEVFVFGALIPILVWQSMRKGSIEEEIEEEEHEGRA